MARQQAKNNSEYVQSLNPQGYIANREITNLNGQYLVKGSKNTLIKKREKVISRGGYELVGTAKTMNKGIHSSCDWVMSNDVRRSIRGYYGRLEVWYDDTWNTIKDDFAILSRFNFVNEGRNAFWDSTELIDLLIFVDGASDNLHSWSGAITKIASVTATTLTKMFYMATTTIGFNNNGADPDTIVDTGNGFVTAGFAIGDKIVVSGSASNNGEYTIAGVTANVITLSEDDSLTTEATGASVILKKVGEGTWAESRFLTAGTRHVIIGGVKFQYTGGEDTGTLTGITNADGLTPVTEAVANDDIVMQAIKTATPAELDEMRLNIVGMVNNHIFVGSYTDKRVFIASNTDYTDFSFTSPLRVPGEGFDLILDASPKAFAPDEDQMYIGAGRDDWYKISMELSSDQQGETVVIKKLKTATDQAPVSQGSIVNIKNAVAFLSREGSIDTLGNIENVEGVQIRPISDDIKDDLTEYDKTNAHGIYFRRNMFMIFPEESVMIIYNQEEKDGNFWQPPQLFPIGRISIIEVNGEEVLCGHSANSNETYKLFIGRDDNGGSIEYVAAFGYENYGTRFTHKKFTELATELYMTQATEILDTTYYDFRGATDVKEFELRGDSSANRFAPNETATLGSATLGRQPFGSSTEELPEVSKYRFIKTTAPVDFFERQRIFSADGDDVYFEILAYGENAELSENEPNFIRD
jgi:hypothetical protein